jgi:hypothetical protein
MSDEIYYRTVVSFEVLSAESITEEPLSLGDLHYMTTEGHCSGAFLETVESEVSREEMSKLLIEQGSDPEFLLGEADEDE